MPVTEPRLRSPPAVSTEESAPKVTAPSEILPPVPLRSPDSWVDPNAAEPTEMLSPRIAVLAASDPVTDTELSGSKVSTSTPDTPPDTTRLAEAAETVRSWPAPVTLARVMLPAAWSNESPDRVTAEAFRTPPSCRMPPRRRSPREALAADAVAPPARRNSPPAMAPTMPKVSPVWSPRESTPALATVTPPAMAEVPLLPPSRLAVPPATVSEPRSTTPLTVAIPVEPTACKVSAPTWETPPETVTFPVAEERVNACVAPAIAPVESRPVPVPRTASPARVSVPVDRLPEVFTEPASVRSPSCAEPALTMPVTPVAPGELRAPTKEKRSPDWSPRVTGTPAAKVAEVALLRPWAPPRSTACPPPRTLSAPTSKVPLSVTLPVAPAVCNESAPSEEMSPATSMAAVPEDSASEPGPVTVFRLMAPLTVPMEAEPVAASWPLTETAPAAVRPPLKVRPPVTLNAPERFCAPLNVVFAAAVVRPVIGPDVAAA